MNLDQSRPRARGGLSAATPRGGRKSKRLFSSSASAEWVPEITPEWSRCRGRRRRVLTTGLYAVLLAYKRHRSLALRPSCGGGHASSCLPSFPPSLPPRSAAVWGGWREGARGTEGGERNRLREYAARDYFRTQNRYRVSISPAGETFRKCCRHRRWGSCFCRSYAESSRLT